jgi:siderophore synthetase component
LSAWLQERCASDDFVVESGVILLGEVAAVSVAHRAFELVADVRSALGDGVEAAILVQWIQGGLLVCVHRYLSEILEDRMGYPEAAFWAAAERVVAAYQQRFPELEDRFALFDMDAPAFVKLCLNRVRMLERKYDDAASRPVAAAAGWITNPLAPT